MNVGFPCIDSWQEIIILADPLGIIKLRNRPKVLVAGSGRVPGRVIAHDSPLSHILN